MHHPGYRRYIATYVLAMMADNIEHVISYWKVFQNFHSPALGGFAVLSHWLPFLFFSVPVGALGDRFDPRRIIQFGMLLFVIASLSWGILFLTDTLTMWEAMLILVIHGCAGVFWQTSSQLLLHDIVPVEQLQSAVRLNATGRYLGVLVGPAVGGAILLVLLTELLRNFGEWRLMIYSCALILILFFLPGGLVAPTWRRIRAAWLRRAA